MITIHQPEFLPWLGFFDRIKKSDIFVILDDVGYQKNGFINRNRIKTGKGPQWITIPVRGRSPNLKINEIFIDNSKKWSSKILASLQDNYHDAPFFEKYFIFFEKTFDKEWEKIIDLDIYLIKNMCGFLGIKLDIKVASQMNISGAKTERLVNICKTVSADTYLSGPGGKNYMDLSLFEKNGIKVIFQDFKHPQYSQMFSMKEFMTNLSIIDLLFNCGEKSKEILNSNQ